MTTADFFLPESQPVVGIAKRCGFCDSCEITNKGQTGVEMEALTAVSVSCLTIYDMIKGIDREATISQIKLINKITKFKKHQISPINQLIKA